MKRLVAVILTLVMALSLCAVGASAEETHDITMAMWSSNEAQQALFTDFANEFAAQKGIKINLNFEVVSGAEISAKVLLELQGGNGPDLLWILENAAPQYLASGYLAELDDVLEAYDPSDLSDAALELWRADGKTYAVPFSTFPFFIVYNSTELQKAGCEDPWTLYQNGQWTWKKLREIAKQVHDTTGMWGYELYYQNMISLMMTIRSNGGEAWNENGVLIDSDEAIASVQFLHDMVCVDGSVVPLGEESSLLAGQVAMGAYQISKLGDLADVDWEWGVAPIPTGAVGSVPLIGQAGMAVNAESSELELTKELMAYMTSTACMSRMATYWPPCRYSVLNSEEFLNNNPRLNADQMKACIAEGIANGKVLPSSADYTEMATEAQVYYDKLWSADADVAEIMHNVAEVYREYID